jgi:hypothetical protein
MTLFPRPVSEIIAYLLARDPLPPLVSTGTFDDSLTDEIEASALPGSMTTSLPAMPWCSGSKATRWPTIGTLSFTAAKVTTAMRGIGSAMSPASLFSPRSMAQTPLRRMRLLNAAGPSGQDAMPHWNSSSVMKSPNSWPISKNTPRNRLILPANPFIMSVVSYIAGIKVNLSYV